MTTTAPWLGCTVTLLCVLLWAPRGHAYPSYDNGSGVGCVECHDGFQGGNGPLHQRHRIEFGISECNLCHPNGGSTKPVLTYFSGPGGGFGCAGCHGQDYGETSPNSGQPKATAYGLRQFHIDNGEPICGSCHVPGSLGHPNPFPVLFGEDEPPPYYDPAFSNLTDPCADFQEDLTVDGDSDGLDNDGDGDRDFPADADCVVQPETPTATPTATATPTPAPFDCASGPIGGCIAPGKAVLIVNEKKTGKEKMKLVLKKLQPAVTASQFGNPVSGSTAYKICIYDAADQLSGEYNVAQGGAICGDLSCWSTSKKGYKYRDKSASADGILKINLFGGDPGKGKVLFLGKNEASTLPTGIAAALQNETSATVQVLTSDASCFGVSLSQVKKADGALFKALGP